MGRAVRDRYRRHCPEWSQRDLRQLVTAVGAARIADLAFQGAGPEPGIGKQQGRGIQRGEGILLGLEFHPYRGGDEERGPLSRGDAEGLDGEADYVAIGDPGQEAEFRTGLRVEQAAGFAPVRLRGVVLGIDIQGGPVGIEGVAAAQRQPPFARQVGNAQFQRTNVQPGNAARFQPVAAPDSSSLTHLPFPCSLHARA